MAKIGSTVTKPLQVVASSRPRHRSERVAEQRQVEELQLAQGRAEQSRAEMAKVGSPDGEHSSLVEKMYLVDFI